MRLDDPHWQGISAIATIVLGVLAIVATVWAAIRTSVSSTDSGAQIPAPVSGMGPSVTRPGGVVLRVSCTLMIIAVTCVGYLVVWFALAVSMGFDHPSFLVSPQMIVLGALPAVGALLLKSPPVGAFLGGLPLGLFALYLVSVDSSQTMSQTATPFAYFVVFSIIGGMIGIFTASPAVALARKLRFPLPRT